MNKYSILLRVMAMAAMAGGAAAPALAGEDVIIVADESRILDLPQAPGTLVIGNPGVADVTVDGSRLFLHGRGFGKTNLLVLNVGGQQMAEYTLRVVYEDADSAVVYKAGARQTYSCAGVCEPVPQPGDQTAFFNDTQAKAGARIGFIRGQAASGGAPSMAADTTIQPQFNLPIPRP